MTAASVANFEIDVSRWRASRKVTFMGIIQMTADRLHVANFHGFGALFVRLGVAIRIRNVSILRNIFLFAFSVYYINK